MCDLEICVKHKLVWAFSMFLFFLIALQWKEASSPAPPNLRV